MPLALGRDVVGLAPGERTLATVLHEAGYATAAFSAANPYISPHFGYEQGFEVFYDFLDFGVSPTADDREAGTPGARSIRGRLNQSAKRIAEAIGLARVYDELYFEYCTRIAAQPVENVDALRQFPCAEAIVAKAISWLTSVGRRPFFLWLHLMDPHSPYYPTAAAYRELTGRRVSPRRARYVNAFWSRCDLTPPRLEAKKNSVVELYDAGIRSVDGQVGRLVEHLKRQGQWDQCVFVLTADHGEEFLEHGRRYHAPVDLSEEITRVPLLMRTPTIGKRSVPETPLSHLNLAPTLLEILGVPVPHSFKGKSLWSNLRQGLPWEEPVVMECCGWTNPFRRAGRLVPRLMSVRDARYKIVLRLEPGSIEELYDFKADRKATQSLPSSAESEVRVRFLQAIREYVVETVNGIEQPARLRARLRDLRVELEHRCSRSS